MTHVYSVSEEIYSHEYLWRTATRLAEESEEKKASYVYFLSSLLISYMAYEAFVNFCGQVLLPDLWRDEKRTFKGKGIEGKLEAISEKLGTFSWSKGTTPYQTIRKLENFRDLVAHGKIQSRQYRATENDDGSPHIEFKHEWDSFLTVNAVREARAAILSFCQSLLVEMRKSSDHPHLTADAFHGSLASASAVWPTEAPTTAN